MKYHSFILVIILASSLLSACNELLLEKPEPNTVLNKL